MAELNDSLTFKHGAKISNRFVQPPMLTNSGIDGEASEDTINYWRHHSKSGGMYPLEDIYYTFILAFSSIFASTCFITHQKRIISFDTDRTTLRLLQPTAQG